MRLDISVDEYENINGMRVSEIARLAVSHIDKLLTPISHDSQSIILGNILHSFILRKDRNTIPDNIVSIDYDNYRTKVSQQIRDETLAQNKIPILKKELDKIIEPISQIPFIDEYFPDTADYEISFQDNNTRFGLIKGRIDCINNNSIWDLKITTHTDDLDKKIFNSGYQVQMYLYMNLANINMAHLLFLNPNTFTIHIKQMNRCEIEMECEALLDRAVKMQQNLSQFKDKKSIGGSFTSYNTPEWCYTELIKED